LSGTGDVLRELKAKEAEMDAGAKREMALRVIIGRAIQQGFVPGDSEQDLPNGEVQGNGEVVRRLTDAMVRLKQEKAVIQVSPSLYSVGGGRR
jgi:hypothetical protein